MEKISKESKHGTIESYFSSQTTKKQKSDVSLILGELIVTQRDVTVCPTIDLRGNLPRCPLRFR